MHSFTFYSPTEVVFGPDTELQAAELVQKYGGSRVFVVYGGGSVQRSGLLERVTKVLTDAGLAVECYGGAKPNPTLEHARDGVRKAIDFGADLVLAIGGGSAIDTGKAVAHGAANPEQDIWSFWSREVPLERSMPVGAILTIPAAGSEMSNSSVLTNEEIGRKRGLSTDFNRPKFAIMNPELTYTLPDYQIGCGIVDIMMHTMERYFNPVENPLTDALAETLLRNVIEQGRTAMADHTDYTAMSELMWAGSLSHNGLTGLGGQGDWSVHQLGHEISARFDLAHGASLAAVWGSWAGYVSEQRPARFARFARNVWGIQMDEERAAAEAGINATVDFFASLGMPTGFDSCIGLQTDETCADMAYRCAYEGTRTIGTLRVLGQADIEQIYLRANH
ncbi:MAG: iron-containing alcohol dehydrogenase [Oscillospiraceae bacterium]|nr:iron-containing alcohol dehydrogenase [Eubacteriales bacterium]MDY2618984.1 iron-containing alcohol dehydrogenase [Oscillospiraceae bacterium]